MKEEHRVTCLSGQGREQPGLFNPESLRGSSSMWKRDLGLGVI